MNMQIIQMTANLKEPFFAGVYWSTTDLPRGTLINRLCAATKILPYPLLSGEVTIWLPKQTLIQAGGCVCVRVCVLPVPQSCYPMCRRPQWRRAPGCAQRPRRCPGWRPPTERAPAGVCCGSWPGPQASRSDGLDRSRGKQIKNLNLPTLH